MRAWSVCALAVIAVVLTPYSLDSGAAPVSAGAGAAAAIEKTEAAVLARINAIRHEHGIGALRLDAGLSRVARDYSCRMADDRFFGHTGPAGGLAERIRAAGKDYEVVGENLAQNVNAPDPVDAAVRGWMRSEGHRANILNAAFTETGVGICARPPAYYFTQLFLRPPGARSRGGSGRVTTISRLRCFRSERRVNG